MDNIHTIKDFDFEDKRVLLRVDFNVPLSNGKIANDSRIRKTLPTINYLLEKKAKQLIIISHLGRPNGEYMPEFSLKIVAEHLQDLLNKKIYFEVNPHIKNINSLPEDEKLIMLENLRFEKEEENNDEFFAQKLASFADIFVFDAFGVAHREHASVVGIPKFLPSCIGFLMETELSFLNDKLQNPEKPYVAIIGGSKGDKIEVINNLLDKVDNLIIGGVLANTFLKAQGHNVGSSKLSSEFLDYAKQALEKHKDKIALPVDFIVADAFSENAQTRVAGINDNIDNWLIMDIGPYTISGYIEILKKARTVVWAGPVGVFEFEKFRRGTWDLARTLAELNITKIICGGDSAAAIESFNLAEKMTHVSTGGGASLKLLSGKELPALIALRENYEKFKQ